MKTIGIVVAVIFLTLTTIKWIRSFLLTYKLSKQAEYDLMNLDGYLHLIANKPLTD
jgi:hypothetical protein